MIWLGLRRLGKYPPIEKVSSSVKEVQMEFLKKLGGVGKTKDGMLYMAAWIIGLLVIILL